MKIKSLIVALVASIICLGCFDASAQAPRKAKSTMSSGRTGSAKSSIKLANRIFIGNIYTQVEIWLELNFLDGTRCEVKELIGEGTPETCTATYKIVGKKLTITAPSGKSILGMQSTSFIIKGYGTDNCQLEWDYDGPQPWEGTLSEEH